MSQFFADPENIRWLLGILGVVGMAMATGIWRISAQVTTIGLTLKTHGEKIEALDTGLKAVQKQADNHSGHFQAMGLES